MTFSRNAFILNLKEIYQKNNLIHEFGLDMDFKTPNGTSTETETPSPAGDNNLIQNLINDNKTVNEMDFIFGQANMNKQPTNGKKPTDELEHDEDMGPETDVDVVDEVMMLSPKPDNLKEDICETNPFAEIVDNKDIEMLGEVIDRVEGNCLDFFRQEFSEKKDDSFEKESNVDLLAGGKIEPG